MPRKNANSNGRKMKQPKARNREFNQAMMEIGRSSAASRHRMATDYRRKPKHVKKGWD